MRPCISRPEAGRSWLPPLANRVPRWAALGTLLALSFTAHAQWLSQSFTLKPGWNAIFTHVDVSYQSLDSLVPDESGPVAEVWLWKPTFSTIQFVETPYTNAVPNSQWAVWTSARGDTDTLTTLVGNGAYLVNNRTASDYVWTVKGRPVPPSYQWTTTGLNFLGFPTPASAAPNFATYLAPAPSLDLAKTLQNQARVFRYPGGNLGSTNPTEVVSFTASTTPVTRGQAFWVRGSTNYYNRYYGPVEVVLQSTAGLQYQDTLGTYSLRLKNLTTTSRTVTFNLLNSEPSPAGQVAVTAVPQLLVRGDLSTTTLTYSHTVLAGQQFTLAPQGQAGSELEVVLGLNRGAMLAAAGSLYAGILRITDTLGLQQVDVPVSATVPKASGLWVGQASISQVGQYLKTYPKVDTTQTDQAAQINAAAAAAGQPPSGAENPGATFVARQTTVSRGYSAVASSLDGRTLVVAAATNGTLYVSQDYGTSWTTNHTSQSWSGLACSADGSVMVGTVYTNSIYVSSNYGATWAAVTGTGPFAWAGIAASADGNVFAAVVSGGSLYTSVNRGGSFVACSAAGIRSWSSIAISADGSRLVASVNPGLLYTSSDSGVTWAARETSRAWTAVASSESGSSLIAAVDGGFLYTSSDAGANWIARAISNSWNSVASSTDGKRLAATAANGQIYTSDDAGVTWIARDQNRNWAGIVASGDATRLVAVVDGGAIYTLSRTFASYTVDQATGLVLNQNGLYLSTGVNTNLAKVASLYPLRLLLHLSDTSQVNLLQRVFVGKGANATNDVITTRESLLDATQLASARRISTIHFPFSRTNLPWTAAGTFSPGNVVVLTVLESYKNQASNPFLHTFHPDHDNLDANFKTVQPRGVESYDITRTIKLTFSPAGTDFASLTATAQSRSGTYEETMALGSQGGASRDFRLSGSFTLQLISPIATLTTQ
ncbi:MAG: hypothetical protein RL514_4399 [Verrucomicrobiota bacterium]|jgi:hypothetical protein